MYKRFGWLAWLLACFLVLGIAGCGTTADPDPDPEDVTPPEETEEPEETDDEIPVGGTFNQWIYWEASSLNPILAGGNWFPTIYAFDPLIKYHYDGSVVPALAESWDVSDDGTEYTFHLRDNVVWHDGTPFSARDVVFTINAIFDENTRTTLRGPLTVEGTPVEVEMIDDHTVKFLLSAPYAPFLSVLGGGWTSIRIVPEHLLADVSDINEADFNMNPVGTGPFKFVSWSPDENVIMERNDDYYKPVYLDRVVLKIIANAEANVAAFEAGELHNSYLYDVDVIRLRDHDRIRIYEVPGGGSAYLWTNVQKPMFADVRVRRAFAHAMDRDAIGQTVTMGLAGISHNIYTQGGPHDWVYNANVPKYEYDVERAKELLDEAGWLEGNGLRVKDGQEFVFEHMGQTGFKQYEEANVLIQSYLEKVGVQMDIRLFEPSAFQDRLLSTEDPKPMDTHLTGRGPTSNFDPDFFTTFHSSQYPEGQNPYGYSNARADELLELGRTTVDEGARRDIYMELQEVIMADIPYIPLYWFVNTTGVWDTVGGLPENLTDDGYHMICYFIEDLYIKSPR